MSDLESILKNIEIKELRKENKNAILQMKNNGMTKEEIKALYTGISIDKTQCIVMLPIMFLWIEEVWNENIQM